MFIGILNEFRKQHGKAPIHSWNGVENDYCLDHSFYMAREQRLSHAPDCFLNGKSEAIAMCAYMRDFSETASFLVFDVLAHSQDHSRIILDSNRLSYGIYVYNNNAYLTIRGWNE
jgi:uncharacterized protein YkwD